MDRRILREFSFQFAAISFFFGCGYVYLFAETGKELFSGNLGWSAQITLFLLFVVVVERLFVKVMSEGILTRGNFMLLLLLLAHVFGGIYWFVNGVVNFFV